MQTGTALRKMGGVLSLSPMVDVCRTPSFNRLEESYGEDGYLSAVMGTAFVKGLQQGDLKKEWELALNTIWDMVVAVMLMRRR